MNGIYYTLNLTTEYNMGVRKWLHYSQPTIQSLTHGTTKSHVCGKSFEKEWTLPVVLSYSIALIWDGVTLWFWTLRQPSRRGNGIFRDLVSEENSWLLHAHNIPGFKFSDNVYTSTDSPAGAVWPTMSIHEMTHPFFNLIIWELQMTDGSLFGHCLFVTNRQIHRIRTCHC